MEPIVPHSRERERRIRYQVRQTLLIVIGRRSHVDSRGRDRPIARCGYRADFSEGTVAQGFGGPLFVSVEQVYAVAAPISPRPADPVQAWVLGASWVRPLPL